jgi:hypothetical protein
LPPSMPLVSRQSRPFASRPMGRRSPMAVAKGMKTSIKGNKSGPKRHPQRVTITTSCDEGDNDKENDDSDEEHVDATECDFKHQAQQPADHFEKLLETTCPNHVYPIKHKLKEYTMMKNYMTTRVFHQGEKSPKVTQWERLSHPSLKRRQSCQSTTDPSPMSPIISSNL